MFISRLDIISTMVSVVLTRVMVPFFIAILIVAVASDHNNHYSRLGVKGVIKGLGKPTGHYRQDKNLGHYYRQDRNKGYYYNDDKPTSYHEGFGHPTNDTVKPSWAHFNGLAQDVWGTVYPDCNGRQQSPINIKTRKVKYDAELTDFNFEDLHNLTNVQMVLTNDGHAVHVDLSGREVKVTGGGLLGEYLVDALHFHWGQSSKIGSEHSFNNRKSAFEVHVVMHSNQYSSVSEALGIKNAVAVMGFLVKARKHNRNYDRIVKELRNIQHKGDIVTIDTFDITTLFPSSSKYFRYDGSLTTPGCQEGVIWTVFKARTTLSDKQLEEFRKLGPNKDASLWNNWRYTQPLNGRVVTSNFCQRKYY